MERYEEVRLHDGEDADVVFVHEIVEEGTGRFLKVVDSRSGGAWLPKRSVVLALVDHINRRTTYLNGASPEYPYGKSLYRYDLNAGNGLHHSPIANVGAYIALLIAGGDAE
ncbi:MAG: hypothetical protein A2946_03855 [Candidatus Liptonbacteria bacterium RIFCSPLOWO2_01_FULL_53_13]|uniref:Uncharacterized protein n=1 Tax=Candidatus Liptonbacteria bacterium RIFCSPLOWO2_01_FULL_53_13 TaxID=1798651 RepID=A0A1G2CHJ0_9BACT|nr:MAG: hypothetical protein A2946_03855 [Candidatus Liptonbacteria bacterium RIFCSPLOWO2_01_FULL_53_13]